MVEVKGAREMRSALRKYQPDLAKELNKEMASYLSPVARQARSYLPLSAPLSGWAKSYQAQKQLTTDHFLNTMC